MQTLADFLAEFKRRRVFRVTAVYAGVAFVIFQIIDSTFVLFGIPNWVGRFLVIALVLGLPIVIGLAWAFDITEKGVVRTTAKGPEEAKVPRSLLISNRVLVIVAIVAVGVAAWSWWGRPTAGTRDKSIAVLPFANYSEEEGDWFSDGITDDILTHLSKIGDLKVIARTSVMQYKNTEKRIRDIGRELGVATILEGSVRRADSRVRITSQLVDAETEEHLWAETYDRDLTDIFAIQSDVARQIAAALKATLTSDERRYIEEKPTDNPEAYDFYLRGEDYLKQVKRRIAIQMYEKAVALDPTFALAYSALSWTNTIVYWFHEDHTPERLAKAKAAVDQALALDPDLPEAHFALGMYYYQGHLDYDRALEQFTVALKGMPNSAPALAFIGYVQRRQGKIEQALVNQLKAFDLDPRSASTAYELADTYRWLRRYPEAERYYNRAIALQPDSFGNYSRKVLLCLLWEVNIPKARRVLEEASRNLENAADPRIFTERARLEMFDRNYSAALEQLIQGPAEVMNDQFVYIPRSLWFAQTYKLMDQGDLARAYYDSVRVLLEAKLQYDPGDSRYHSTLGIAYAGLGRKQVAIQEGKRGVELLPIIKEAVRGYYREKDLAIIYTMVGEYEAAINKLEYLLSIYGDLSVPWLRLDPTWDPLREHPRFQALLEKYGEG